ncbi:hypothetical protein A5667_25570 [Mycolicibacterium fortuitum]|uniref:hypothetical protein n=1 Tax=Mycolicibacterium fortuitum TaxID=1766 RepID=UPI0007ECE572|nr:hypothetical protein [Mycolicibacterium fortuitum]OBI54309.1 hypothetical protein A5667_25570 [Mycolicibacterium fortuitum]
MSLHLIAAVEQPKITDWLSVIVAAVGVFATAFVGVAVAIFASGYRMRIRAYRDKDGKVLVRVSNSGRVAGKIGPVRFVQRSSRTARAIRWAARRNQIEPILVSATPGTAQLIQPGDYHEWWLEPIDVAASDYLAPTLFAPMATDRLGRVRRRRVRLRIDRGNYRPRYFHWQRIIPFRKIRRLVHVMKPGPATSPTPTPQQGGAPQQAPSAPVSRRATRVGDLADYIGMSILRLFLVVAVPVGLGIIVITVAVVVRACDQVTQIRHLPTQTSETAAPK